MTRMSREFSLVLMGAGLLTAGYFAWPEENFEKATTEQDAKRVGGRHGYGGAHILFIGYYGGGSYSTPGARPFTSAGVAKSGFGSIGARVGGGGG